MEKDEEDFEGPEVQSNGRQRRQVAGGKVTGGRGKNKEKRQRKKKKKKGERKRLGRRSYALD